MLIQVNIKNFLSFGEKMSEEGNVVSNEFSMLAGSTRQHPHHVLSAGGSASKIKLLKTAILLGANGSGKSNFVKAVKFIQTTVLQGLPKGFSEMFNRTRIENRNKPSYFEIQFRTQDKNYNYGFEIELAKGKFISEWLYEISNIGKETLLFERDIRHALFEVGGSLTKVKEIIQSRLNDVADDESVLFLTTINQNKKTFYKNFPDAVVLKEVYKWFLMDLKVLFPGESVNGMVYLSDEKYRSRLCEFLKVFGTEIETVERIQTEKFDVLGLLRPEFRENVEAEIERTQIERDEFAGVLRLPNDLCLIDGKDGKADFYLLRFKHKGSEMSYRLGEESDGTIRLIDLCSILLDQETPTYVVDELDRGWHPLLTEKFVEVFLKVAEKQEKQLIATTHESLLLDQNLLRNDEIWFVNKENGNSYFTCLNEFKIRYDKQIQNAYLDGRYDGIPILSDMVRVTPSILEEVRVEKTDEREKNRTC